MQYFSPRPPHGGRHLNVLALPQCADFYPRPPHGGRLKRSFSSCLACSISIHALRMEGDRSSRRCSSCRCSISIHALRMEGDNGKSSPIILGPISIHALRMEGDGTTTQTLCWGALFLSTPSAWRATSVWHYKRQGFNISIHALRMEGDRTRRQSAK